VGNGAGGSNLQSGDPTSAGEERDVLLLEELRRALGIPRGDSGKPVATWQLNQSGEAFVDILEGTSNQAARRYDTGAGGATRAAGDGEPEDGFLRMYDGSGGAALGSNLGVYSQVYESTAGAPPVYQSAPRKSLPPVYNSVKNVDEGLRRSAVEGDEASWNPFLRPGWELEIAPWPTGSGSGSPTAGGGSERASVSERQVAVSSERQVAASGEQQVAVSSERQVAVSSERQVAASGERQVVASGERQVASEKRSERDAGPAVCRYGTGPREWSLGPDELYRYKNT
jgi:hypothetical protein